MSDTKRETRLRHQDGYTCSSFFGKECDCDACIYEAARAKDAELIQRLVDALEDSRVELCSAIPHLPGIGVKLATSQEAQCRASLAAAEVAGFKPSDQ